MRVPRAVQNAMLSRTHCVHVAKFAGTAERPNPSKGSMNLTLVKSSDTRSFSNQNSTNPRKSTNRVKKSRYRSKVSHFGPFNGLSRRRY
jgi:hypothetical protein